MSKRLNVVIDTNVFINGIFFADKHENCAKIMNYIDEDIINPYFSQETIGELVCLFRVFSKKCLNTVQQRLDYLGIIMEMYYYGYSINTSKTECEPIDDEEDIKFLKTAIEGNIDYLITKDYKSGLFNVKNKKFKIMNAEEFVNTVEDNC